MRMLRVTTASGDEPRLVNPAHVVQVAPSTQPGYCELHLAKQGVHGFLVVNDTLEQLEGELNACLATHGEMAVEVMNAAHENVYGQDR